MQGGNSAEGELYDGLDRMAFKLRVVSGSDPGSSEWRLRMQFLNSHVLLFASAGQGWMTVDGTFMEISPGWIYVGFPGQYVEAYVHGLDEPGLYWLSFDVLAEKENDAEGKPNVALQTKGRFPANAEVFPQSQVSVSQLCKTIDRQWSAGSVLQRFGAQIRFQELLYILLEQDSVVGERDGGEGLELVKDYMERNYGEKITIDDLAKEARMSPRHLMRLFKKRFGCSAMDYLTVHRIKQAQMLMMQGGKYSLKDIARHVGYQDDMYFRRKFRQLSGIPPAAFMRNCKRKIVAYHASAIGSLLALKVIPYAAPESHPWADYYRRKYETDNVLSLSLDESERMEQLRMAKPDCIVLEDGRISEEEKRLLQEIAPLCVIPKSITDWRSQFRYVAHDLNRGEAAETWLKRYAQKAAFVSEQITDTVGGDKVLVIEVRGSKLRAAGSRGMASVLYEDLGLAMPSGMILNEQGTEMTTRQLQDLAIDRLLIIADDGRQVESLRQEVMQSQRWQSIPSIKYGRADFFQWSPYNEYTPLSHDLVLDELWKLWRNRA